MKTNSLQEAQGPRRCGNRRLEALTSVELMITSALIGLVFAGVIYVQYFGLRYDQLVCSKVGASEMSRMSFDDLTADIRSAKIWAIGNGGQNSFASIANGSLQQGNALQLSFTTDTNAYVRYFFTSTNNGSVTNWILCRMTNGMSTSKILAQNLTNDMYFKAETFSGGDVTDLQYKYVVHVQMRFCQFQYPLTKVGPGYYYDFYQMDFRVTPHCPDGA